MDGGLVARSARGAIGEHWWSRRFLEVLESFALGSRLTRGKNYARRGQVLFLDVAPGVVTASVQGSRKTPYKVSITLPAFSELVWAKVEVTLAEQAIHSARLLAGEMPPDLEEVFRSAGAPLFPERAKDLTLYCSCPDWEVPCKHLAATFYLLAERFDDDPFAILLWRGRSRTALLGRLRELRGSETSHGAVEPAGPTTEGPRLGAMMALADLVLADGDFWTGEPVPALPVQPELPTDLLLRQLPVPGAPLGGPDLVTYLAPLYSVFGTSAD
ncbi:MAG TPA: SWIM zinc finger family protein [Dermatophilaceae bacterium]|nr:SWIM zinc finger family protein [Dermatophilaceae bacterium]